MRVYLIGEDGNVGSAIKRACQKEGWTVFPLGPSDPLPVDPGALCVDAGPAGYSGWKPSEWANYYGAFERAVRVVGEAERSGYAAVMLCSTPFVGARRDNPYDEVKLLIEGLARAQNRHGRTVVIADRIGMQNNTPEVKGSRFEESVRQREGELGERVIAAILFAVAERAGLSLDDMRRQG